MAEKEPGKKVAVYRSVSFKRLESWSANKTRSATDDQQHKSKDLESGAHPPLATEGAVEKAQPSATRSVGVSRKVSKISAANVSTADFKKNSPHSISPSIRQLSEKFNTATERTPAPAPVSKGVSKGTAPNRSKSRNEGLLQKLRQEEKGYLPISDRDPLGTAASKAQAEQDLVSESVLTHGTVKTHGGIIDRTANTGTPNSGKKDYFPTAAPPGTPTSLTKTVTTEDDVCIEGASAGKSQRDILTADTPCVEMTNWPSVTKIRKLFGDGHRKPHRSTSDADDLKSASQHFGCVKESALTDISERQSPPPPPKLWQASPEDDRGVCCVDRKDSVLSNKRSTDSDMDTVFSTKPIDEAQFTSQQRQDQLPDVCRTRSPSENVENWTAKVNSDPRPPPPVPPPRSSSVPLSLRAQSLSFGWQHKQEARQQSDSLHSLHSSSKPQAAPSAAPACDKVSSSEEEDSYRRGSRGSFPLTHNSSGAGRNKNGSWVRPPGRSSGSEEDGPPAVAHNKDNVRRKSLRKKKKNVGGSSNNGESDDSYDEPLMEPFERRQFPCDLEQWVCKDEVLRPRSSLTAGVDRPSLAGQPRDHHTCPAVEGSYFLQRSGGHEFYKRHFQSPSVGSSIPQVSRVSKVNISSFMPSPCGSQSSSRYSSTETLKEEDQPSTGSSLMSKSFHGNFTMYRSPSFSQGDCVPRPQVRVRPKLPFGIVRVPSEGLSENRSPHAFVNEKAKHRMSVSNPDIASETRTLLNFLKMDLSDLRYRKRGKGGGDRNEAVCSQQASYQNTSPSYRVGSRAQFPPQGRLSLKDLTATLRRAKSFTYSEKPVGRRQSATGTMKQSPSEQMLDTLGDRYTAVPDREVQSDVGQRSDGFDDELLSPLRDQYIQEARQVFRDISQMGAQQEYYCGVDYKENECFKRGEEKDQEEEGGAIPEENNSSVVGNKRESVKSLKKVESDENIFREKSVDELSGHESSLTDEGIVTEPETGPCGISSSKDILGKSVKVRKQSSSGLYKEDLTDLQPGKIIPTPDPVVRTEYDAVAVGGESNYNKSVSQGPLEAPSTPSAIRRRRKFSSAGNNGSDSSNGSNGESSGEAYRSLSDPMPHRRCSISEDAKNFSVDSNLLGSLNSKNGMPESSATDLSEYTGSAASDLSVCSDGLKDYSTVIQSIVREPGAMDKLNDEKGNGKTVKKKSFSDPSRRGESDTPGFKGPSEPINEMDQSIIPSSSEPILSEQRDELGELQELYRPDAKLRSQSEHMLPSRLEADALEEAPCFPFDPKLAEVLSPRMARRSSKKRNNRATHQEGRAHQQPDDAEHLHRLQPSPKLRPASKHVRHASEPATFVPIVAPETHLSQSHPVHITVPEPSRPPQKPYPVVQAPSLEDVTKQYMLTLNTVDTPVPVTPETSRSTPATPTTGEAKLLRKANDDLSSAAQKSKPQVDMRKHVMMTLLDTEQSYVESLRTLIQGYMKPLKQPENSFICDPSLVDEMFYQIPEILEHHEQFLEQVLLCVQDWHDKQKVGSLLIESFSKDILVNIYSAYIDNFLNAKDAVRIAKEAKPAFLKFLEQCTRENKEKQALSDLMIKPVQRIPRYELLVKDLLKHTPEDHPDHPFLLDAQKNIKRLAERINKGRRSAEEAEKETRVLQEVEAHIEGVENLLNPQRKFLRQEMVVEVKTVGGKKDRSLFLFSDLLICTTLKRKSGSLRRSSMSLYTAASVIDTSSKYKFLWKLPLEDVEMVKGTSQATNRENIQKTIGRLDEDLSTLGQISKLSETLSFPHQGLDDVIRDLMAAVHRELAEKQSLSFSMTFLPTKVELTTASAENTFVFEFTGPEARSNFEQAFEDAKKKLAMNKDYWDPEFLKAIPIMKTRSGMQFSCASPSHSCPENTYEVWVCNSDGYVGQVCLLNIKDEPTVEACIAVCSARIICISAVPGLKARDRGESLLSPPPPEPAPVPSEQNLHISISGSSLELVGPPRGRGRELVPFDSDDTDDESSPSPSSTLQSQASRSTISSSFGNDEMVGSKEMTTETTSSEEEQEFPSVASSYGPPRLSSDSPMDGRAMRRSSRGSFTRASLEDLLSIDPEAYQSSVWLGTEDGCIHVYQSSDNIRNRKNSMKMQHSASILCILYLDNKVFVSLANGEIIVYQREAGSFWDPQNSQTLSLGTPGSPVTKMVPVTGRLWCGCQNRILILNTNTLAQEHTFQIGQDSSRCVTSMVSYGQGVWIALQGSAQVRLYHAVTCESLMEVDVAPAVHKMLAGSDAIIRQHKAACLRITALLACKDLLWIGTSAGVVLTLTIPPVSSGTSPLRAPPVPMGSAHGHTGHVRFLTSIELPEGFDVAFPLPGDQGNPATSGEGGSGLQRQDSARRRASTLLQSKSNLLVISGGDGYEDFMLNNSSETVGRDDSTNHLLLWRL
nr:PREDICTED: rho guanine nucleotide exchange factor 17 [Lepisosteus oculatus]